MDVIFDDCDCAACPYCGGFDSNNACEHGGICPGWFNNNICRSLSADEINAIDAEREENGENE